MITTITHKTFKPGVIVTRGGKTYQVIDVWNRDTDNYTAVQCALIKKGKTTHYISHFQEETLELI